ncbi:NADH:ubiquinone oxidoreductase subunit NDUFA12 [Magnetospira sp. QH-2]|uniref:NADH:ubiquinone oxidoreductase subunit NDUFA12 n=1 Tax=Magnetospira sp. (strain QH-2) TaxID=1288970 RepID=UPI0003E81534|nr:NADH:ubiquinone oxidoreductase subunit NDUFA12 [Magnetospira sp. QH-2]CCQ73701.1 Putative NADH-ubiquinone oxidoreductase subunit B17.2 (Complex I-B17.2) (CI-B17.2) [Magnetospira sp. QH-2]
MITGTLIYTWLKGEQVGKDQYGNRYFRNRKKLQGRERRWVLYKGSREASKVPPEWHAWLHHTVEEPLTDDASDAAAWQQEHLPNLTGTQFAFVPPGHDLAGGKRSKATGDYQAWTPGED